VKTACYLLFLIIFSSCTHPEDEQVIFQETSPYNTIFVTENSKGLRTLRFKPNGVRQSVIKPGDPDHIELAYLRTMLVGLAFQPEPARVLVIGLGGGTLPQFLHFYYPETAIDAVDIDPVVIHVAENYFGFREDELMKIHRADGKRFIDNCRNPYDIIFLDAFGADGIPPHLTTNDFFSSVSRALRPTGVVVANLHTRTAAPPYAALVHTFQQVFAETYIFRVPEAGNRIVIALPQPRQKKKSDIKDSARMLSETKKWSVDLEKMVDYGYQQPLQ